MRPIIGIIGSAESLCSNEMYEFAKELGDALMSAGFRIVTGGKGGVMEAVCMGAMNSHSYFEGSTICILPEADKKQANAFCDIIIPTGVGIARNIVIINTADVLVAIGGGAGTLSEISFAWQKSKKVLCVTKFDGWAKKMADVNIDKRNKNLNINVNNIDEIIEHLRQITKNL